MDIKTIIERLRERHNIVALNEMQQLMAGTSARKIILLSPTGSGKTAAFAIRLLRELKPSDGTIQAVIMAPARELVLQIADVIRPVAAGFKTVAFYGGHSMADEVNSLSVMPDIVVATPGRLLDHITRGTLDVAGVGGLVLDEYDKNGAVDAADYTFTLTPVTVSTETNSSGYYSTTTYISAITPYVLTPAMTALNLKEAKLTFTFTKQTVD